MARVSVVIPTYNYGKYIKSAINSVLNQSMPPREIIVVDDGSTDDTKRICMDFGAKIQYSYQQNSGPAAARNRGAKLSQGDALLFLDADDKLTSNAISKMVSQLDANPDCSYVYTDMQFFGDASGVFKSHNFDPTSLVVQGNFIGVGVLIRKAAFNKVGGFRTLPAFEDYDLWLRLYKHGFNGLYLPEPLYLYRRHEGSRDDMSEQRKKEIIRGIRRDNFGLALGHRARYMARRAKRKLSRS